MKTLLYMCAVGVLAGSASGSISSTFDNDAEGWSFLNDARDFMWDATIGNPGEPPIPNGGIRARDAGQGPIWYYAGSEDYNGNLAAFYNGTITWDTLAIQGNQGLTNRADVILVGGGLEIGINISEQPVLNEWVTRSVDIVEGDWFIVSSTSNGTLSGTAATEAQIIQVLSDVTGFYLQGEYTNGADQTALDNVFVTPAPGALALMGIATLATRRRR